MALTGGARARVAILAAVPCTLSAWSATAVAHHSHTNYLTTEFIHLEGVVAEMHWMNPHTWIYLEVTNDDGEPTIWVLEGASPAELMREGWEPDSVREGDSISVRCHQLRDRSNGCLLGYLTPEGGVEKEFD
ncbi:MAG TPA: DUF6152 family protein [Gammaproteobacteria bacterium]